MKVKLTSTDLDETGLMPENHSWSGSAVIPNIFIFSLPLPQENNYSKNHSQKETLHMA